MKKKDLNWFLENVNKSDYFKSDRVTLVEKVSMINEIIDKRKEQIEEVKSCYGVSNRYKVVIALEDEKGSSVYQEELSFGLIDYIAINKNIIKGLEDLKKQLTRWRYFIYRFIR